MAALPAFASPRHEYRPLIGHEFLVATRPPIWYGGHMATSKEGRLKPITEQRAARARRDTPTSVYLSVSPPLKRALTAEVQRQALSMNDLVVGILASHYNMPFSAAGGRHGAPAADKLNIVLRMPRRMKRKLQYDALRRETNMSHTISLILSEHLGIHVEAAQPTRRTPFGGGRRAA